MKCDWKTEFKCSAVAMRMHSHSVMENGEWRGREGKAAIM